MGSSILYIFSLILEVLFNFFLGKIYKIPRISKVFLDKNFKLYHVFVFDTKIILMPPKANLPLKKNSYKRNPSSIFGISDIKIIIILLIEVVIFYIELTIIEI